MLRRIKENFKKVKKNIPAVLGLVTIGYFGAIASILLIMEVAVRL